MLGRPTHETMRTSTIASWQPHQQQEQEQRSSPSLRSPPRAPQQHDGGRHPYPHHHHHHQYQHRTNQLQQVQQQQQRMPRAGAPAPPPYSDRSDAASAGEFVSPLMRSPRMPSPLASPFQHQQPHHRRYRSSLPAPPPLRSLTLSPDHLSLRLVRAHAPHHQQRTHHVDQSRRPATCHAPPLSIAALEEHDAAGATARHGPRAHNRRSTRGRSSVQLHVAAAVLSNDQAEDKEHPSTPVDQRIPAMVPPSYDVYNLDIPGAGVGAAGGATHGAHASTSLTSQAYQLKTVQPQLLHPLKLVDGVWRVVVPPQQHPPTSRPQLQPYTAAHPRHDHPPSHSPRHHNCDQCGGLDNGETASATEAALPTCCHGAESPTYRIRTTTTFIAAGTPCGLSVSACGGDWRSPCLAATNIWCHHQHYPQPCHARTTPASVTMRSSSVGLSDGVDMALSPVSTPARAPRTPRQQQQQQPHLPHDRHGAHHHCHAHSLSVPSFASEEAYAMCGQCSTPHEADLAAGTPSSVVPGAAASVAGRGCQQALATPTVIISRAAPATARDALTGTTVTASRWAFTNSAAASTSIGATLLHGNARTTLSSSASVSAATAAADGGRGGAVAAHDDDDDAALLHASSSAYLRYRRDADFLYAVDDDDDGYETAAVPMARGATSLGNAFMLAAAQATAAMDSPATVSRCASSCSPAPSSVYYSPQQFRFGDLQPSAPATATTTPALPTHQPHNWTLYGQRGTHTASQPSHGNSGGILQSCTAVTPLRCSCCDAAGWAGPNVLTTPPSACCGAPGTGDGWRSPIQWNPRQARDDLEMEAVKQVAQFALAQVAATAATGVSLVSLSPSYPTISLNTAAPEAAVAVSPSHARDASRAEDAHDNSVSQDTVTLDGEEEAAEWLELLLHYRDRENESGRIRRALADAATTAQAPTTEAGGTSNHGAAAAAVTAVTTLSWWATSLLMRDVFPSRGDGSAPQQQQRHHAGPLSAVSSPSMTAATRAALAPPPAQLCAAMSAHRAARTISRCVRRTVWRMRENERQRVSASVAARVAAR
ncbi:hypothetical protein LMXM_03_0460 [Leishmania mexicana MHOM/GT/2001/U1103]|uniref:Uncharacterized protein n=1 Tax=Leishmania mexicana (strain MHOM/GT/2001/U1103) TaxID=929439 RepID=E9AJS9_LEIMU|nr:hypothetical protein LMXM_03_0460 [Leishmania mexicana MHOM/GT/2001/U1103]CBZ23179.1 hypothetical protein LMXM_03_0460 [Leishmania mexicana MHOM/GT/2001/U1103]